MFGINFEPVSNREDWIEQGSFTDPTDGSALVIDDAEAFEIAIRAPGCSDPVLTGSFGDGKISFPETNTVQWRFPASVMRCLRAGNYEVGATVTKDGEVTQIILGTLPVYDGVVS